MDSITREQQDLLVQLVEADRQARKLLGRRDSFAWHTEGGMGPTHLLHAGIPDGTTVVDPLDIECLIDAGFLQQSGQRSAYLTPAGINYADALLREQVAADPLDLSWSGVEPILNALWEAWVARGAPPTGVPVELVAGAVGQPPQRIERLLDLLTEQDWTQKHSSGTIGIRQEGPTYAPSASAIARFAGWPSPAEVTGQFLTLLDNAIAEAHDEPTRGRLRVFRESAARVGENVLAQLLTALAEGRIHL